MKKVLLLGSLLGLAGCGTLGAGDFGLEEIEPASEYAAGDVNLAAFEPIPWYTVSDELAPNFNKASANDLIGEVAPIVGGDSFSASRRTSIGLQAQFAGTTVDSSEATSEESATDNEGVVTNSSSTETTSNRSRATPEQVTVDLDDLASALAAQSVPSASSDFSFDPEQKYRAAAGLFQNIQLLDSYLEHSPGRRNQTAYLVRLQITVSPYAHQQPYDVYTRIYFGLNNQSLQNMRVFPLIIADNLERINTRRISEELFAIQASLSGRGGLFSGGLGAQSALDRLRQLVGSDLNSLVTYTQEDDSSLTVRFGAPFNPASGWAMRARTYDVTAVVVIPDQCVIAISEQRAGEAAATAAAAAAAAAEAVLEATPESIFAAAEASSAAERAAIAAARANQGLESCESGGNESPEEVIANIDVFAESVFRHARLGTALPAVSESDIEGLANRLQPFWEDNNSDFVGFKSPSEFVEQAIFARNTSLSDDLINRIFDIDLTLHRDLFRARIARTQSFATVEVKSVKRELPRPQWGIFSDNGSRSVVQLAETNLGDPDRYQAYLVFGDPARAVSPRPIPASQAPSLSEVPLQSLSNTYNGQIASWTFPSLAALGIRTREQPFQLLLDDMESGSEQCSFDYVRNIDFSIWPIPSGARNHCGVYPVRIATASANPPRTVSYKVTSYADQFTAGSGTIAKANLRVTLDAIDIRSPRPADIAGYRLSLRNAELGGVIPLQANGSVETSFRVPLDTSKNAATIPIGGLQRAYRIELAGQAAPAGAEIEIIVEALDSDGKVIPNERASLKFTQPSGS